MATGNSLHGELRIYDVVLLGKPGACEMPASFVEGQASPDSRLGATGRVQVKALGIDIPVGVFILTDIIFIVKL